MALQESVQTGSVTAHGASSCAFCKKVLGRARMLSCMHNICLTCVKEEVNRNNDLLCPLCVTVTKAPDNGISQLLALPNSYNLTSPANNDDGEAPATARNCEECRDDELAEMACYDCGLYFCELHGKAHLKSRTTCGHEVKMVHKNEGESELKVLGSQVCPRHSSEQLELYCEECNDIFCQRCEQQAAHSDHKDRVMAVKDAAKKLRADVQSLRDAARDGGRETGSPADAAEAHARGAPERDTLQRGLQMTTEAIEKQDKRVESASAEINSAFDKVVAAVAHQRKRLLDDLDGMCWNAQKVLEGQQQRLQVSLTNGAGIDSLLQQCESDVDFLRMARWLQNIQTNITECVNKDTAEPLTPGYVVFDKENVAEMELLASHCGKITVVSHAESDIRCRTLLRAGEDLEIKFIPKDTASSKVSTSTVKQLQPVASLEPRDGGAAVQSEMIAGTGELGTTFKKPAIGFYTLRVKLDQRHVCGSPLELEVSADVVTEFDPSVRSPNFVMTNNNSTATLKSNGQYHGVCSPTPIATGRQRFLLRIESPSPQSGNYQFWLLLTSHNPPNVYLSDLTDAYGWGLHSEGKGQGGMTSPGGVQQNDIIVVTLDCDKSTATFKLERTGHSETVGIAQGQTYRLYLSMYCNGALGTLFPQMSLIGASFGSDGQHE